MASSKSYWQELTTDSHSSCPKLFYKFCTNKDGYELLFTDLIGLWRARSNVEGICAYAKDNRTSIDPSESKSQFKVLLHKLEQSLSGGTNALHRDDDDSENESVVLKTTIKLPRPLQPLEWQFNLKPEGAGEMAEHILRPSLHEASESKKKLDSLFDIIKQKDHIISKLLERLENSSVDLSLIFPRITSLKSRKGIVTTKDAQAQVPGLAPFKRSSWDNMFRSDSAYASFEVVGLSNLMVGCEKCPKHTAEQHEQWLKKLPSATRNGDQDDKMHLDDRERESGTDTSTGTESDEFETQSRKDSVQRSANSNDISHDSDANGERSAKPIKLPSNGPSMSQHNRTVQSASPKSSSPILPPQARSDPRRNSTSSTSSAISEDLDLPTTHSSTAKHGRLGKIGNQPKQKSKSAHELIFPSSDNDDFAPPPVSSSPQKPKPELMSSSPPPLPPPEHRKERTDLPTLPRSSSTASSLNPPTPRKLGRLGSNKPYGSTTPDTPRKAEKASSREDSGPTTPSRRLGRLGVSRNASQAVSQSQRTQPFEMKRLEQDEDKANDSDTSTSSTASTAPANPDSKPFPAFTHQMTRSSSPFQPPQEETKPELTAEEKADRRRQELKRKIGTGGIGTGVAGGAEGQGTAPRKKRKF
ncbi:hypothetical protein H2198_001226 [Neophaeococcomyces mojaviensis]|uniref:Uncharacterized protein n=1 Tax=Neophaeococcomyces mojaviensis TaxID=3383035 RepID=A0ACC3AIK2_9EURO|nr:hypothetical protein H2198_001226 [Knufia sp. JES_112]